MRTLLIFVIPFAICSFHLFGQADVTTSIIEDAIKGRKDVTKIIYLDSSLNYYTPVSNLTKRKRIEGYKDTAKVVLTLSKSDIKSLDSAFKNAKTVVWAQNMFKNSLMLTTDSLMAIFSDTNRGRPYFEKNYSKKYFLFSKPVFIRGNTLAALRLVELYYPVAGNDLLYFYQKKSGEWQQYMIVYLGAW
jgi:hypothetical protein